MPEYRDIADMLHAAGAAVAAAECHGFLCGQLCGSVYPDESLWQEYLDLRTPDDRLARDCHELVRRLLEESWRELSSDEFAFRLLLPGDDTALEERVAALAGWCQGFLSGFGLVAERPAHVLTDDVRDWLRDMEMIARAGIGEPDPDDELALAEVADHVRTGVMLIVDELRVSGDAGSAEELH
jgi:hypothetical protein